MDHFWCPPQTWLPRGSRGTCLFSNLAQAAWCKGSPPRIHLATGTWADPLQQGPTPSSSVSRQSRLFYPICQGNSPERSVGGAPSPHLPLLTAYQVHSIPVGPSPWVAVRAVFYCRELIQASLRMVLALNHRPRCPGQTAFGQHWLGGGPHGFTCDLVAWVLLYVALCLLPSYCAWAGGTGALYWKASLISSTISSGEKLVPEREWPYCCHMLFNGGWHFTCLKANA